MKKTIAVVIAILWLSVTVLGRAVYYMTEDQMRKASDWIVMGKVSATRDLDESSTLNGHKCRGVETTFTISRVLKGDSTNPRTIVLHHYRLDQNIEYSYAPYLLNLNANRTDEYLLYLLKEGTGRFVPVSGQVDPASDAVRMRHKDFQHRVGQFLQELLPHRRDTAEADLNATGVAGETPL